MRHFVNVAADVSHGRLVGEVERLRHQMGLLVNSRSFRLTRPLRWLGTRIHLARTALRRRGGRPDRAAGGP